VIYRAVRGRIFLDEGRIDQAFEDFNLAVEVDPDTAMFLYFRAVTRLRQGDASGAEADFVKAREITPGIAQQLAEEGIWP
jgi:Flp pilus assembly protein TadD